LEQEWSSSNWTRDYEDACVLCEDSGGGEVVFVSQTSLLDSCKSSSGTCASPPLLLLLLGIGCDDPDDVPAVQVEVPCP